MQTGWTATRLGFSAFVVPFLFVYHHELILKGSLLAVAQASVTATLGVVRREHGLHRHLLFRQYSLEHVPAVPFFVSFFGLVTPGTYTDLMASRHNHRDLQPPQAGRSQSASSGVGRKD